MDVKQALARLNGLLPLAENQRRLDRPLRELHQRILQAFAERGYPLSREEMAGSLDDLAVDAALQQLASDDLVVLSPDGRKLAGAYPFTVEERMHCVSINGHRLHAMCALDALSVAPMFDAVTTVNSLCHVTGEPVELRMRGEAVRLASPAQPWVGIRWQGTSGCAARSLCLDMVFLRNRVTAGEWQAQDPENISLLDLASAVSMGTVFFRPLLSQGD